MQRLSKRTLTALATLALAMVAVLLVVGSVSAASKAATTVTIWTDADRKAAVDKIASAEGLICTTHAGRIEAVCRVRIETVPGLGLPAIEDVADRVEVMLQERPEKEISTAEVGAFVMHELKRLDKVAYVRFASVYRHFRDIGEFMSELKDLLNAKE